MPAAVAPEVHPATFVEQTSAVQLLLSLEAAGAVTPTSLTLTDPDTPYDTVEALAAFLGFVGRWKSWAIGDLLNFAQAVYGELFAQIAHVTGYSEQTLLHYQFVAAQIPEERRVYQLGFGVHSLVARKEPREQKQWLKKALRGGWGERELREAMRASRSEMQPPLFPDDAVSNDRGLLAEVALALLRDARPSDDGQHYLIPNEDIARLRAALGQEE